MVIIIWMSRLLRRFWKSIDVKFGCKERLLLVSLFTALILSTISSNDGAFADDSSVGEGLLSEAVSPSLSEPTINIGMAKFDITPDLSKKTVRLAGYSGRKKAPATGVLDHIFVRALVGSDADGHLFALVSADLCYINAEVRDEVVNRLKPHGFNEHNILLAATHTHSSLAGYDKPYIWKKLFGDFDEEVFELIVSGIVSSVLSAKDSMRPAKLEMAQATVKGFNRSRLDPAFDIGSGGDKKESIKPDPERYRVDERLTVVKIVQTDNKPIGAIVHFAAHPTILSFNNFVISADFVGVLNGCVEEALGNGSISMFFQNTLGDAAPTPDWPDDPLEEFQQVKDYGNKLADQAIRLLSETKPIPVNKISYNTVYVRLPNIAVRPLLRMRLPKTMMKLLRTRYDVPFQAVRIGDTVFLGIPGEPTADVGKELTSLCPSSLDCKIIGLANDSIGYLVTPAQYEVDGYTSDTSFLGKNGINWLKSNLQRALEGVQ